MKTIDFILLFFAISVSLSSQELENEKRGYLDISLGFNLIGPAAEMDRLMVEYDFDETTINWLFGGATEHPHYSRPGFSTQLSYSHRIGTRNLLGIQLNYSHLSQVNGAHADGGLLFVRLASLSLIPQYILELDDFWSATAGPAIMINFAKKTSGYSEPVNDYKRLSMGIRAGIKTRIWNRRVTYCNMGTYYLLALPNRIGPFEAEDFAGSASIPESQIGFGHLYVLASFGIHL